MEVRVTPTVLRVKRKRSEDPAEALILPGKRQRRGSQEPGRAVGLRTLVEDNVFRLVATVCLPDEPVSKQVRKAWKRDKVTRALNPSVESGLRIRRDVLAKKQGTRQDRRYRLLSQHRALWAQGQAALLAADRLRGTKAEREQLDSGESKPKSPREDGATVKTSPALEEFQAVDIVQEPALDKETPSTPATCSEKSDPDGILGDSLQMIREQLVISKDGKGREHREREDDYAYDIYYLETSTTEWADSILSEQPYSQEGELWADPYQAHEIGDDEVEEDENSENHWRNQYPDEEELSTDSDSTRDSDEEDGSLTDEESSAIRTRTWNKYPDHVLKDFDYDGSLDFDSD